MKKQLMKAASALSAGALMIGMLAGCGTSSEGTGSTQTSASESTSASSADSNSESGNSVLDGKDFSGVKLVYWSSWEATEPQGMVISDAVKDFEQKTGATVDLEFKGRKGLKEGLIPALDADQQVDLFEGSANKANYGDRIIDLEDLVSKEDYEKDSIPAMMKLMRSYYEDGKLREIPYQMKANGYMYNKALFEKAGITETPKTWDDFLAACDKLKAAGITPLTTDDAYAMQAFGMHLARLVGSDEVKAIANDGGWDKPEVLKTAQAFEDLANDGYFSKQVTSNVWPTGQNTEFATGTAAMYCVGTFVVNEVKNITGPDFKWGFFPYPEVEDEVNGPEAMVLGSQSFSITNKCENPEAAFALIEQITRGSWDAKLAEESIGIPADENNKEWPEQLADVKPYIDQCTTLWPISGGIENNSDITPALKENLLKLYGGKVTAQEFMDNMVSAAK